MGLATMKPSIEACYMQVCCNCAVFLHVLNGGMVYGTVLHSTAEMCTMRVLLTYTYPAIAPTKSWHTSFPSGSCLSSPRATAAPPPLTSSGFALLTTSIRPAEVHTNFDCGWHDDPRNNRAIPLAGSSRTLWSGQLVTQLQAPLLPTRSAARAYPCGHAAKGL